MKIRLKGLRIDTHFLFRIEWKLPLPKIYFHERFEKPAKWTTRIITAVGIGVSFLALPTLIDFVVALVLLAFEVIVENIVFEYSVIIIQPPPEFKVDESQWITNGYLFPEPEYKEEYNLQIHFGPVYQDEAYAKQFFDYLKSWNLDNCEDKENNICLSFVMEADNSYTTYIYANPDRKWLDAAFNEYREDAKYEKYGKGQQSIVMQMVYWKTLPNKKGTLFYSFQSVQDANSEFNFCPFYMEEEKPIAIESHIIKKYKYSVKNRGEITNRDLEFYYGPTINIDPVIRRSIPSNPQDEINRLFLTDLETAINRADSIKFVLAENPNESPPVIYFIFPTPQLASRASGLLNRRFDSYNCDVEFRKARNGLVLRLKEGKEMSIESDPFSYSEPEYEAFRGSDQSEGKTVLAFACMNGGQPVIISSENPYKPFVVNRCKFRGQYI